MSDIVGLTGIAALEAEMRDRLAAKDAEIERLSGLVERLLTPSDGDLSDIVTKKGETAAQLLKRAEEWMALMPMQSPGPQHLVLDLADALRAHISLVEQALSAERAAYISGFEAFPGPTGMWDREKISRTASASWELYRAAKLASTERLSGQR